MKNDNGIPDLEKNAMDMLKMSMAVPDYQFTYYWKHVPTGLTGERSRIFSSYKDFLESINKWNKMGDGEWIYWR